MQEIDLSYLREITGGENEIMAEMVDLFLTESPVHLEQMKTELQQEKWLTFAAETHKLKPTLLYVGLQDIYDRVQKLESDARKKENLNSLPELFSSVREDIEDMYPKLEEARDKLLK